MVNFCKNANLLGDSELSVFGVALPITRVGSPYLRAVGRADVPHYVGRPTPGHHRLASALGEGGANGGAR